MSCNGDGDCKQKKGSRQAQAAGAGGVASIKHCERCGNFLSPAGRGHKPNCGNAHHLAWWNAAPDRCPVNFDLVTDLVGQWGDRIHNQEVSQAQIGRMQVEGIDSLISFLRQWKLRLAPSIADETSSELIAMLEHDQQLSPDLEESVREYAASIPPTDLYESAGDVIEQVAAYESGAVIKYAKQHYQPGQVFDEDALRDWARRQNPSDLFDEDTLRDWARQQDPSDVFDEDTLRDAVQDD